MEQYRRTAQRDEGAAYRALVLAGPKWNLPREWNPPRGRGEDHRRHAPRAERNERSQQQVSKAQKRAQQAQQRAQQAGTAVAAASAVRERGMWHVRAGQERYCRDPQRSEYRAVQEALKCQRDGRARGPREPAAHDGRAPGIYCTPEPSPRHEAALSLKQLPACRLPSDCEEIRDLGF